MCLFGIGVELRGMFKVKAGPKGGGVELCLRGTWCCWTTRVAILELRGVYIIVVSYFSI